MRTSARTALALGRSLSDLQAEMGEVVEGIGTTIAASTIARKHGLDAPICDAMNSVLFDGVLAKDAITDLMNRKSREE